MTETFQITPEQAAAYEELFVPALFGEWAGPLVEVAAVGRGHRVLDVACGTGVVARAAAARTGDAGTVVGLDLNPAMLEVAARLLPEATWRRGDVQDLPFEQASFDRVLCQAALFFFPDAQAALAEMVRVTRPGGVVAVQTFAELSDQPGYLPFVETVVELVGAKARGLLDTYWSQGDLAALTATLELAGTVVRETRTRLGTAHFGSVEQLVAVEVGGTPLAADVDEALTASIVAALRPRLAEFTGPDGSLALPVRGHLVACERRGR